MSSGQTGAPAGDFDLYVLQLFWSPVSCCEHPKECSAIHKDRLVLHGLWPEYATLREHRFHWPQYCRTESFDYSTCFVCTKHHCHDAYKKSSQCRLNRAVLDEDLQEALATHAPGYLGSTFGDHEWIKHGSCSNLDPMDFLTAALGAQELKLLEPLAQLAGTTVATSDLQAMFPQSMLHIENGAFASLNACFDRNLVQIECPELTRSSIPKGIVEPTTVYIESANQVPQCFAGSVVVPDTSSMSGPGLVVLVGFIILVRLARNYYNLGWQTSPYERV